MVPLCSLYYYQIMYENMRDETLPLFSCGSTVAATN